jgi:hypothetical protein
MGLHDALLLGGVFPAGDAFDFKVALSWNMVGAMNKLLE